MPEESPSSPVPTEPKRPMGPIRPKQRIETIDILRGWALLGMLFVNMLVFSGAYRLPDLFTETTDRVASGLIEFFAEQKFVSLFSFLFGLGFALQIGRAEAHGTRFLPRYSRRLLGLLLFGFVNGFLLSTVEACKSMLCSGFCCFCFAHGHQEPS